MTRAYTDVAEISADLQQDVEALKRVLTAGWTKPIPEAAEPHLARLETFIAIAVRVMAKTNPSKIRDVARTVEIQARINGVEVLDG